ncbi:MAG: 1-acyl-sn-glycerol-3-phosphate acyltransferase [Parvibaculaceae bacterium]|nr:1-acyl-sn-glycerol-3-phosphate acyltransferase [Parvibaculaceae bacterium]
MKVQIMLSFRSVTFNFFFYVLSAIYSIVLTPVFALPRRCTVAIMRGWSKGTILLLRIFAGTRYEIRGLENLPEGACLIACKHQSLWDTLVFNAITKDPAIVMKKELLSIPYYGWYSAKARMIAVDREAGSASLRTMFNAAKEALADNRPIVIFPEGTRIAPGEHEELKPGVAAIYNHLKVPCIPAAVNSGLYWPARSQEHYAGKIIIEFLPAIEPGLKRRDFIAELDNSINTATDKLMLEALETLSADAVPEGLPEKLAERSKSSA